MSPIDGISRALGSISIPDRVEKAFLATSKEGSASVLPLEASVIVGRSGSAAKRNGFMEFQERFLEEVAVAIVWLWGISFLYNRFSNYIPKKFPKLAHLNLKTGFVSPFAKTNHVDLSTMERHTANALERVKLNRLLGFGLAASVGMATITAGFVIPWLNVKKTEWLAKRLYKNKSPHQTVAGAQPAPLAIPQPQGLPQAAAPMLPVQNFPSLPPVYPPASLPVANLGQFYPQPAPSFTPRFSGLGSLVQLTGHLINQTSYGGLLAVDTVLTGGRVKEYGKRSKFEGIEIGFRDAASVYFYMFCAPQLMKWFGAGFEKTLGVNAMLQPKVAKALQEEFIRRLLLDKNAPYFSRLAEQAKTIPALQAVLSTGDVQGLIQLTQTHPDVLETLNRIQINTVDLERLVNGQSLSIYNQVRGELQASLHTAKSNEFIKMFTQEATAYKLTSADETLVSQVKAFLTQRSIKQHSGYTTDSIQKLIQALKANDGPFASSLTAEQRQDAIIAVKQAFRHTVGVPIDLSADITKSVPTLPKRNALSSKAFQMMDEQVRTVALQDGRDVANSMLTRAIHIARPALTEQGEETLLQEAEILSKWVEAAVGKHVDLKAVVEGEFSSLIEEINGLQKAGKLPQLAKPITLSPTTNTQAELLQALKQVEPMLKTMRGKNWSAFKNSLLHVEGIHSKVSELIKLLSLAADTPTAHLPIGQATQANLEAILKQLTTKTATHVKPEVQALLNTFGQEIPQLLNGQSGRLMSLYLGNAPELTAKVDELLKSGLAHDSKLLAQGLEVQNQLITHSRLFKSQKAAKTLQGQMGQWLNQLMRFKGWSNAVKPLGLGDLLNTTNLYQRISRNGHYLGRASSMVLAALGLGILVPKLQYALTKRLTGKNEHPGLATLHPGHGDQETNNHHTPPTGLQSQLPQAQLPQTSALRRSNFQAFKTH